MILTCTCQFCGIVFKKKNGKKSKVCSPSCRVKLLEKETGYYSEYRKTHKKDRKPPLKKVCTICQTEFTTPYPQKELCSQKCQKERIRQKRNKTQQKQCSVCKKTHYNKGSHCSQACKPKKEPRRCKVCKVAIKGNNSYCPSHKPKYEPRRYEQNCETCGKSYIAKRKDSKYCKNKCRPSEVARRRLSRRKETRCKPPWMSWKELEAFEKTKPGPNYQLDHIIPLNHPNICGLHVPDNLQWLTPRENLKKSNSFDGTKENNGWRKNT
jgi:hypothetical protein